MTIAIHQPNFFPWIGYFYKIHLADTFVFLDDVEFSKQSYTKRVKIHHQADFSLGKYLSIPLERHSDSIPIKELKVSAENIASWWKEMLVIAHNTYCHSPFYEETYPFLEKIVGEVLYIQNVSNLNQFIIEKIMEYLDITATLIRSSELAKTENEEHVNHQICKSLSASKYISGLGAKNYQSEQWYDKEGIEVEYLDISKIQSIDEYSTHLLDKSIISWLMIHGKEKVTSIF